uniref:CRC domain-containing protein n=1 Tax=Romanomermis culicivorax TaxID=13658 RepID=A0A915J0L8_ROMCU
MSRNQQPQQPQRERCCDCVASQNRCATDLCPCFITKRICDEQCESTRFLGDCLNQAICRCSCENPDADSNFVPNSASSNSTNNAVKNSPLNNNSGNAGATSKKGICSKPERCECLRIRESCSKLCACRQICKNREAKKPVAVKTEKPKPSCSCSKAKKQCVKKECSCRGQYEFCGKACKCQGDCTNGPTKFSLPKCVQHTFLEHKQDCSVVSTRANVQKFSISTALVSLAP